VEEIIRVAESSLYCISVLFIRNCAGRDNSKRSCNANIATVIFISCRL